MTTPAAAAPGATFAGRIGHWLIELPADPGRQLVVFTACDSRYLGFAIALVRSLEAFSPGATAAVHVVNPGNDDIDRLQALRQSLAHTTLGVSIERIDLVSLTPASRRAYYASARFFRLAEILGEVGVPVLALDADSLVVAPIDRDFSNKPNAELLLVRRDQGDEVDDRLAVANGSIWMKPVAGVADWLQAVCQDLQKQFESGAAAWFVDQAVVARQLRAFKDRLVVLNIKSRYADWEFRASSVVWSGKGVRKGADLRFSLLQQLLSDATHLQVQALRAARAAFPEPSDAAQDIRRKVQQASKLVPPRVALYLPRLDQPWGRSHRHVPVPPAIGDDTLALRLHWAEFAARLANAIERKGVDVDRLEVPAWQIEPDTVDLSGADLALVPHRCMHDYSAGETPVRFFMQEYFRWVFVVDRQGWSAGSSNYPLSWEAMQASRPGAYDLYRARLQAGQLASKFAQPVAEVVLPPEGFVFFPLQIPHDQSIRYFCDHDPFEVVQAVLAWSRRSGVPVVFKPHPANPKSMLRFESMVAEGGGLWCVADVHHLLSAARAILTLNSGVGFEALLHAKPVITFGRAEYDCVTLAATPASLDTAWQRALAETPSALEARYRRFVDWFLCDCAVDLSVPDVARDRLDVIAAEIAEAAKAAHATRFEPCAPGPTNY